MLQLEREETMALAMEMLKKSLKPNDASTIQINLYDAATQAYAGCNWIDKDPFD